MGSFAFYHFFSITASTNMSRIQVSREENAMQTKAIELRRVPSGQQGAPL